MMSRVVVRLFAILALCSLVCFFIGCSGREAHRAVEVIEAEERLELSDLWPGFEPLGVPVAIFDGEKTILARHPDPPDGFKPMPGKDGIWVYEGRHQAVTACTSGEIGGARTALMMLDVMGDYTVERAAAVLVHESFHVFAGAAHPDWGANEAEAFTYPVEDTLGLALRRVEVDALRRALMAADEHEAERWGASMLDIRERRFKRLTVGQAMYERGIELMEGTAYYVENRCLGDGADPPLRDGDYGAEEIRRRAYDTGRALCILLDRVAPGWKLRLEEGPAVPLDSLLSGALAARDALPFDTYDEIPEAEVIRAGGDVAVILENREREREQFLGAPGWTVEIVAGEMENAFWSATFDPMNVVRLGPGEVLHKRMLKLSGKSGTFKAMDHGVLTEAAGEHPIFSGICRIVAAGLGSEPAISEEDGEVTIEADGITASLSVTGIEHEGRTIIVRMR
jgi:hypothetical protein